MSSKHMTPELRLLHFNKLLKKSFDKFGSTYKTLQSGIVTKAELELFVNRSKRMKHILEQMILDEKQEISFADMYFNSKQDMLIRCPTHGLVCMTFPMHIISGTGCVKCSGKYTRTQEEFDQELKEVFNQTVERIDPYINQKTKMRMNCTKHGEFPNKKTGSDLLVSHQGCPRCQIEASSEKRKWKINEVIEQSKKIYPEQKDDYSRSILNKVNDILYICAIHCIVHDIDYDQRVSDHLRGHRCQSCKSDTLSDKHRLSYGTLIERCKMTHKDELYSYDEKEPEDYKNGNSPISVQCNVTYNDGSIHGIWTPSAHNHINGSKCPRCKTVGYSTISIEWMKMICTELCIFIQHKENSPKEYTISNSKYKADGWLSELKCIFEFHGCHVHGCNTCYPNRNELDLYNRYTHDDNYQKTIIKKQHCLDQGYKYVEIWYCEWMKIKNDTTQYIIDLKKYLGV